MIGLTKATSALAFFASCITASSALIAPAHADARNGYGGGFIELLVTGVDPTPSRQVLFNQPNDARAFEMRQSNPAQGPVVYSSRQAVAAAMVPSGVAAAREPRAEFQRQDVAYEGREKPGTIVVDTPHKFLYLVTAPGRATRYGIGVGRPGFEWAGVKTITRKAEWPDWTPPAEMIKRRPDLPAHMAGGPQNPLGARALYLGSTLYRIHGTNEPDTIGTNVSSGCIRMMNEDVTDLYERVGVGTRVIVM